MSDCLSDCSLDIDAGDDRVSPPPEDEDQRGLDALLSVALQMAATETGYEYDDESGPQNSKRTHELCDYDSDFEFALFC